MPSLNFIRTSKLLRWPLIFAWQAFLKPLTSGPLLLRRAIYDSMPTPFLVTGSREQFVVSTEDKVIGREIFLRGEFDFYKLEIALAVLKREGYPQPHHLIDVGANIGSIIIPALVRGLVEEASAIEPHPDNLRLLRTNLELNGVSDRAKVVASAVGNASHTTLMLKESDTNSGNHSIAATGIPVRSMRLDDLCLPTQNSLLWLDIEGYEGHALEGASKLISAGMPVVSEFNPDFLSRSGGMISFRRELGNRRLFDLAAQPPVEVTFESLSRMYRSSYTDILAIR